MPEIAEQLDITLKNLKRELYARYNSNGFWAGRLSSSALATATAVFALHLADSEKHKNLIRNGLRWLGQTVNSDGGWGDTVKSKSNISTTMLCWAAFTAADKQNEHQNLIKRTCLWLTDIAGSTQSEDLAKAIDSKYREDKTFSVPILTMCALAGLPGDNQGNLWPFIKPLPFELAVMPRRLFRWLPLSVVSYALPALISMGLVNFKKNKNINPAVKLMRSAAQKKAMRVLAEIQPCNGGFLEAVPLTSFVVMSLIGASKRQSPAVKKGIQFIAQSARRDGSWPIDTNLSTWLTSLTVNALAKAPDFEKWFNKTARQNIFSWLIDQQYKTRHKYTDAAPGGWAWTDLPGGVPDADDTPGALIAINNLLADDKDRVQSAEMGLKWLLSLQNNDGGMPTFCKGWMNMPFDRSAADLTAHAIKSMQIWSGKVNPALQNQINHAMARAIEYLRKTQNSDGSWAPLWFGNENNPTKQNPLYGTARVILGICQIAECRAMLINSARWILTNQNDDGGWGAGKGTKSSVEETALAVDALASLLLSNTEIESKKETLAAAREGGNWLIQKTQQGQTVEPAPIGLYFAQLWYFEELYPYIFTASALHNLRNLQIGLAE